jgi:hypothetical protein
VVLPYEHLGLIAREYTRDEARTALFERAKRSTDELIAVGRMPANPHPHKAVVPGTMRSPMTTEEGISFVECGMSGGKFSAVIPRWAGSYYVVTSVIGDDGPPIATGSEPYDQRVHLEPDRRPTS